MRPSLMAVSVAAAVILLGGWVPAADMFLVGDLGVTGGFPPTTVNSISADGLTVVGSSNSTSGREAFRWTAAEGIVGLGDLPGGAFDSLAFDVSGDGSAIVGRARASSFSTPSGVERAAIWTPATGEVRQLISLEPDVTTNTATRISRDGTTIYGTAIRRTGPGMFQTETVGFRWTSETEAQTLDTLFPDYDWLFPISPNDQIWAAYQDFPVAMRQFSLIDMSGEEPVVIKQFAAYPTNVIPEVIGFEAPNFATDDGSIVVGQRRVEHGSIEGESIRRAFIEENGDRTYLAGTDRDSSVQAMTDDGKALLLASGPFGLIWTRDGGHRALANFFANDHGMEEEFAGWTVYSSNLHMSADGKVISGGGVDADLNDHVFVVRLSDRLPGDANFDGRVGLEDFNILKSHLGTGMWWNQGNFDGDRDVDLEDFAILKDHFGVMAAAIPEPQTWLMMMICAPFLFGIRGKRHG